MFEQASAPLTRDEVLDAFLDYTASLGFELYSAQEEAILALLEHKHVVLDTPTGSGKSLVAMALHFMALSEGCRSVYTCPIKALVNEKFFDFCRVFGPQRVGLLTGDGSVNRDAPIICCTAEILANMALMGNELIDYVVMDEFHFYADPERGGAWQIPLITMKDTVFLLMSATLGDMTDTSRMLEDFTSRKVAVCSGSERPVPLEFEYKESFLQETVKELVESREAPVYVVNFTQREAVEQAQALSSIDLCSKDEKKALAQVIGEFKFDTPFGKDLRRLLRVGIGIHHAGLLPKYRRLVERLSQSGMLKVVSGTDSLGMGVNIPLRTVIFTRLCKFDGEKTRILSAREFHQIAGRAGRKGFDDHGNVVVLAPEHVVENRRISFKIKNQPHLKNKLHRKTPPKRGYKHWDESTFDRLLSSRPEPLGPVLELNHGMVVAALKGDPGVKGNGYRRLMELISRAHHKDGKKRMLRRKAKILFKELVDAGIIELTRIENRHGTVIGVNRDLQDNFSLHHTLSLYLVETIEMLDTHAADYALDLLSLVEAVLEDPVFVLRMQEKKLKDELIARLKAQGVDFEERMSRLEEVECPKPKEEFLLETFRAFSELHPWVKENDIRPKSVAREMYEKGMGFNSYVKDLGLARGEGVLLRYLSQVYQTASQNVPVNKRDDLFSDILSYFRTMLELVDSSLLNEWEGLAAEAPLVTSAETQGGPSVTEQLLADPRKLAARVRNELYMIQADLNRRDFESACEHIRQIPDNLWTPKRMQQEIGPYFGKHSSIILTHEARLPHNTTIREQEKGLFLVQQKIVDPGGEEDWAVFAKVDLRIEVNESEPLIDLVRIGI
ncbi:MAG: DUF3516 domain-containing protein [Deltaproteobacteria bacterium]|nr:DUF3516 domain-containing protein [Deltaproteobacteria bacterium]